MDTATINRALGRGRSRWQQWEVARKFTRAWKEVGNMDFKEAKEELKKSVSSVKYFNEKTFEIIMQDIKRAGEILKEGGNVQEFYRDSETSKTRFYLENGGAYCQLLTILS